MNIHGELGLNALTLPLLFRSLIVLYKIAFSLFPLSLLLFCQNHLIEPISTNQTLMIIKNKTLDGRILCLPSPSATALADSPTVSCPGGGWWQLSGVPCGTGSTRPAGWARRTRGSAAWWNTAILFPSCPPGLCLPQRSKMPSGSGHNYKWKETSAECGLQFISFTTTVATHTV